MKSPVHNKLQGNKNAREATIVKVQGEKYSSSRTRLFDEKEKTLEEDSKDSPEKRKEGSS